MIDGYESADELAEAVEEQVLELVAGIRAYDAQLMNLVAKLRRFRGVPRESG